MLKFSQQNNILFFVNLFIRQLTVAELQTCGALNSNSAFLFKCCIKQFIHKFLLFIVVFFLLIRSLKFVNSCQIYHIQGVLFIPGICSCGCFMSSKLRACAACYHKLLQFYGYKFCFTLFLKEIKYSRSFQFKCNLHYIMF